MTRSGDTRIARNTAFLYGRMIVTIGLSLYTSRVVLEMLGIDNFGIYSVVGSIVTIFAFINGSMAGATQRFLNYEIGRGMEVRLKHTFASAVLIHLGIALLVVLAAETVGLWYVNTHLVISPERLYAANWTYQLSILACICTILQVPFMASVVAHERMDALAVITMMSAVLKLAVALSLTFAGTADTLILYAVLMLAVSVISLLCFVIYSRRHFGECRFSASVPGEIVRGLLGFSASDIFGNLCYSLRLQSVALILNRFGGEMLNAAAGLNLTVSGAVTQFGTTIISAFRPQIIQQYAADDFSGMQRLMCNCSKFSLLMVSLIAVPTIICMDFLLGLWLVDVPPYLSAFCRLTLVAGVAELVVYTINCGVHATGKIRFMSITTGLVYLIEIPAMWLLLKVSSLPWIVYALHIAVISLIIMIVGTILGRLMPQFHFGIFLRRGVVVPGAIIVLATGCALAVSILVGGAWLHFVCVTLIYAVVALAVTWRWGIDAETRADLLVKIKSKLKR